MTSTEKVERRDWLRERSVWSFDLCHFLSADRRLARCSRGTSDNQGADRDARAGPDVRGHRLSKQDVSVEHRVSVALLVFKRESSSEGGSADKTAEEKQEGGTVGSAGK